jgi:hypothetical protein
VISVSAAIENHGLDPLLASLLSQRLPGRKCPLDFSVLPLNREILELCGQGRDPEKSRPRQIIHQLSLSVAKRAEDHETRTLSSPYDLAPNPKVPPGSLKLTALLQL